MIQDKVSNKQKQVKFLEDKKKHLDSSLDISLKKMFR